MRATMNKTVFPGAAAVLVLAAVLAAGTACGSSKPEAAAAAGPSALAVKTVPVVRRTLSERLTYTGTVEAIQKINLTPEIAGKVERIFVEEGQAVRKGQVLAALDAAALRLQLKQAEAGVAAAEANLATATKTQERMGRLLREKAVSDQQAEQVKLAYDAAKAQLEQAAAGLNLARHYLEGAELRAPWDGVVSSRNVQEGDVINPMMGGLSPASGVLTLMDFSRVKVSLDVGPADIARVRKGQPAVFRAADGGEITGTVTLVTATADALAKKFKVEVSIPNPGGTIRPGTFGTIALEASTREAVLAVPQSAVLDNKYVFLAEGGRARRREVALGLHAGSFVEIVSGLAEGDVVIVEGNYGLIDGAAVEVRGGKRP